MSSAYPNWNCLKWQLWIFKTIGKRCLKLFWKVGICLWNSHTYNVSKCVDSSNRNNFSCPLERLFRKSIYAREESQLSIKLSKYYFLSSLHESFTVFKNIGYSDKNVFTCFHLLTSCSKISPCLILSLYDIYWSQVPGFSNSHMVLYIPWEPFF